uniref:PXA domain-containing protein n=1 Tax=Panagrellus redivivus TaxID=6233 RepID=A0A7E4USR2_PANRE
MVLITVAYFGTLFWEVYSKNCFPHARNPLPTGNSADSDENEEWHDAESATPQQVANAAAFYRRQASEAISAESPLILLSDMVGIFGKADRIRRLIASYPIDRDVRENPDYSDLTRTVHTIQCLLDVAFNTVGMGARRCDVLQVGRLGREVWGVLSIEVTEGRATFEESVSIHLMRQVNILIKIVTKAVLPSPAKAGFLSFLKDWAVILARGSLQRVTPYLLHRFGQAIAVFHATSKYHQVVGPIPT